LKINIFQYQSMLNAISSLIRFIRINSFDSPKSIETRTANRKAASNVIVSLTSTPSRIAKIAPTLYSLIDQSIKPSDIYINIPEKYRDMDEYDIPNDITKLSLVTVKRIEKDLGPASKLLPILKLSHIDPNTMIIILDDDQIYSDKLIENYITFEKVYPNSALCLCGWRVPSNGKHNSRKSLRGSGVKIFQPKPNIQQDENIEILQGASSFMVKPRFFNADVFDYSDAPKQAFFVDDIWFSGHLARNGINKKVIKTKMPYGRMESVLSSTQTGLVKTDNSVDNNNDALYEYFKQDWKLFD